MDQPCAAGAATRRGTATDPDVAADCRMFSLSRCCRAGLRCRWLAAFGFDLAWAAAVDDAACDVRFGGAVVSTAPSTSVCSSCLARCSACVAPERRLLVLEPAERRLDDEVLVVFRRRLDATAAAGTTATGGAGLCGSTLRCDRARIGVRDSEAGERRDVAAAAACGEGVAATDSGARRAAPPSFSRLRELRPVVGPRGDMRSCGDASTADTTDAARGEGREEPTPTVAKCGGAGLRVDRGVRGGSAGG